MGRHGEGARAQPRRPAHRRLCVGEPVKDEAPIEGVIDEWAHASQDEAIEWAKQAAATEGLMCGPSAGAALKVASEVASRPESAGKTIVVLLASHGIRYTTHPLWGGVKAEGAAALPSPPSLAKDIDCVQWRSEEHH